MKNYQLILCETLYKNDKFIDREVCEVGSTTSSFSGKAINVVFYSKIDGTHELSFDLPRFYFDEETGNQCSNELVDYINNKNKLILKDLDKNKEFHFTVNKRTDKHENGDFSYSYSCTDAYIEELSKTGYGLTFTDEVDGNGLGTIHELAERILKDSGWEYSKEKTGKLLEYSTEIKYNPEQRRYDTVYIPQPVHPIEYIKELNRYCNRLNIYKRIGDDDLRPIYCYEETEQILSNTVQNLLYNSEDFTDLTGWTTFKKEKKIDENGKETIVNSPGVGMEVKRVENAGDEFNPDYYLRFYKISGVADVSRALNDTAADANKYISANQPYIFRYDLQDNGAGISETGRIAGLSIFNKNPLTAGVKDIDSEADYHIDLGLGEDEGFEPGKYYVIKTNVSFSKPYFVFRINCRSHINENGEKEKRDLTIKSLTFFEAKGKNTAKEGEENNSEYNNLTLLASLTNGKMLTEEDKEIMVLPLKAEDEDEKAPSAYTHSKTMYFYRNHDDETVTYIDTDEFLLGDINRNGTLGDKDFLDRDLDKLALEMYLDALESIDHPTSQEYLQKNEKVRYYGDINMDRKITDDDYTLYDTLYENMVTKGEKRFCIMPYLDIVYKDGSRATPIEIIKVNELPKNPDLKTVYKLTTDGKYYQYYQVERDGVIGGAWDLAFYGEGVSDKSRTLVAEKSNRFNLLQELAELFKVWCVFEIEKDEETGEYRKQVYFKENAINQNFSGFHAGVNLNSIERIAESEEIVTKMFVEDIENEYSRNGFVTTRLAKMNPWGENYFYNFKHYVDQHLLNGEVVERDLSKLYTEVHGKNASIISLNDKTSAAAVELNNLSAMIKSISYCISSCLERITSLDADMGKKGISAPDQKKLKNQKKLETKMQKKYISQKKTTEKQYNKLKVEYDNWEATVKSLQKEKEDIIHAFEMKYLPYIKEGVWSDSSYVDNDTYYLDAQKVSNTSAVPKTTWNISVTDRSSMEGFEDFQFSVGDQTILTDNEFFGVDFNATENYVFEVLITGIKENLDNSTENEIEVRNYLTSFEDLFQRISAATQTLELNEQTYDKAAYFTNDGAVDKDILQNSLLKNALTLANSSDNSYVLNEMGLSLQSLINPSKKMRAIADGIFFSNSTNLATGEPEWKTGITAEGINARVITSGEINTSLVKIYSDGQVNFSWGAEGITAYDPTNTDGKNFIRLDGFGLYSVKNNGGFQLDDNGDPWFKGLENRAAALKQIVDNATFSLTDNGLTIRDSSNNIAVQLLADGTSKIAGWIFKNKDTGKGRMLYQDKKVTEEGTTTYYRTYIQAPDALSDKVFGITCTKGGNADEITKKTRPFYVQADGTVHMEKAEISGSLTVGEGATIGAGATIAGWEVKSQSIMKQVTKTETIKDETTGKETEKTTTYRAYMHTPQNSSSRVFGITENPDTEEETYPFVVYANGTVKATKGTFSGDVKIGGDAQIEGSVKIGGTTVTAAKLRDLFTSATGGAENVTNITHIHATGGDVGGWDINKSSISKTLSKGKVSLTSSGVEAYATGMDQIFGISLGMEGSTPCLIFYYENPAKEEKKKAYLYGNYSINSGIYSLYFDKSITFTNQVARVDLS